MFIQALNTIAAEYTFCSGEEEKFQGNVCPNYELLCGCCVSSVLMVTGYIDLFKYFIPNKDFGLALKVVPVLLLANVFLGVYYNLSIWYKLSHKTGYGALVSIMGAIITVVLNLVLIPSLGIMVQLGQL